MKPVSTKSISFALAALAFGVAIDLSPASASSYLVTIDTAALSGAQVNFAWDLIGNGALGGAQQPNTVTLSNFSVTGGTLGGIVSTNGTVTGSFPGSVSLTDSVNFFNELLVSLTLGTQFSFQYTVTDNLAQPQPTGFSALFVDPLTNFQLFPTTDPTGADVLFMHTIDGVSAGGGFIDTYTAINGEVSVSVAEISETPLPAALPLFASGVGVFGVLSWRRRRKLAA